MLKIKRITFYLRANLKKIFNLNYLSEQRSLRQM